MERPNCGHSGRSRRTTNRAELWVAKSELRGHIVQYKDWDLVQPAPDRARPTIDQTL